MFAELLSFGENLGKVFETFKVNLILGIIINVIILAILFKLSDVFIDKVKEKFKSNENAAPINHIIPLLGKVIKFVIAFVLIASFLQSQGYSLTSLIAGFGITGLAVGFAAQQTIASMFGTVALLTDKVYKIGDYVKINGTEGTVESISIRSTKIRTLDNFLITVPNDTAADSVISNVSKAHKRRLDLTFGVTYDTSDEKLNRGMEIIKEVVASRNDVHKDVSVFLDALDNSSINLRLLGYVKTKAYDVFVKTKSEILLEVVKRFRAEGIDFAFPSQTVYMVKDS